MPSLRSHLLLLLLLSGLLLGCRTHSPHFPIGIYGVPESALPEAREAGFNIVTGPARASYLEAAQREGLKVLAFSAVSAAGTNRAVIERLRQYDRHPALWGWYLVDEPDFNQIPPAAVERFHRTLKRHASKPSVLVVMSGSSTAHYGQYCDILGVDFYPVPWAPLSQFGREMKVARIGRGGKPYFAILQAFDWSSTPEYLDTEVPLRPPTLTELRCMAYMALAQRAGGVFFYAYDALRWHLPDHELWHHVKAVVGEVNDRLPLFTAEHLWWSPALVYLEGVSLHNEMYEHKVMLSLLEVKEGSAEVPPGRYVLAINTTDIIVPMRLRLPAVRGETVPVLGSVERASLENGVVQKSFSPYEAICYGPLPLN